jgi:hypothetical protein
MAKKKSKASKSSPVRKPLPVASEAKIKSMNMKFRAVDSAKTFRAEMKPKSSKRFSLVHVYGGTDPQIICHRKTFDQILKEAKKFHKSDDYNEGQDGLFYILTQDGKAPRMFSFTSSDMEDEDAAADHADLVRHDALGLNDGPARPEKGCGFEDDD